MMGLAENGGEAGTGQRNSMWRSISLEVNTSWISMRDFRMWERVFVEKHTQRHRIIRGVDGGCQTADNTRRRYPGHGEYPAGTDRLP